MSGRLLVCWAVVGISLAVFFTGCAEQAEQAEPVLTADKDIQPQGQVIEPAPVETKPAEVADTNQVEAKTDIVEVVKEQVIPGLALKFKPGNVKRYMEVSEYIKSYKHERPWPEESEIKKSKTNTEILFIERIENVADDGSAVANITIDSLKRFSESPKGVLIDFISNRPQDKGNPLNELVGQNYRIKISPSGRVEVLDANQARSAISKGAEYELVQYLLSDELIVKRHSILALPEDSSKELKVGDSWSKIESSPKEMLQPKIYEKVYTLEKIIEQDQRRLAIVKMKATDTGIAVPGGIAEKMDLSGVEHSDSFQGLLVIELDTGALVRYHEKLIAEWVAVGKPDSKGQDEDETKPSVLVIGYSYSQSIEVFN